MRSDPVKRFWSKVNKRGPLCARLGTRCWSWTSATGSWGYGMFWLNGRSVSAHKHAYESVLGPVPKGLVCRHQCDNPSCVRPDHLLLGTTADNIRDCAERGRQRPARGERHAFAKLTDAGVAEMRARYRAGGVSQRELARQHGVSQRTVLDALELKTWRHVK